MVRTNPMTGAIERPWRQRERGINGMFVLADPAHGAEKHHKNNATFVSSYSEAFELVRKGYSIRMSDGRSPASLVSPGSLQFIDEPVECIDDLWTYTMPEVPFSLDTVLQELRCHLVSQASDIGWTADPAAASAFIGFDFCPNDDGESEEAMERIDLERFNITRIVREAYRSAFRPGPGREISEEDVDELEQIIMGTMVRFGRRHWSPLDREGSALQRTLLAAYHRWQIVDGNFFASDTIDQSTTDAIGILTGMPAHAVRNALSRDGISLVKSKIDGPALMEWVITRRNFAPLRQSETWAERWTYRVLHELRTLPLPQAFASVRKRMLNASPDLDAAEQIILARREACELPTEPELRRYAAALDIAPDNFILELHRYWASN